MAAVVWRENPHPRAHERIPGYEVLTDDERLRLRRLVEWRFAKAREVDRSAFMVLSDQELLRLSQSRTPTLAFFRQEGLLPPGKIDRYGAEVLAVLAAAGTPPAG